MKVSYRKCVLVFRHDEMERIASVPKTSSGGVVCPTVVVYVKRGAEI